MRNKNLKIFLICVTCVGILSFTGEGTVVNANVERITGKELEKYYDGLIEKHLDFASKCYGSTLSKEDVNDQVLEFILMYDSALSMLEKKYPSYDLKIVDGKPMASGGPSYVSFQFSCDGSDEYSMYVSGTSTYGFNIVDNFYNDIIKEEYSSELLELLSAETNGVVDVETEFTYFGGLGFDEELDVSLILSGEWSGVDNDTVICVDSIDTAESVREFILEENIYGSYSIVNGDDELLTVENCVSDLEKLWGEDIISNYFSNSMSLLLEATDTIEEVLNLEWDDIRSIYEISEGKLAVESASKKAYGVSFSSSGIIEKITEGYNGEVLYQVIY